MGPEELSILKKEILFAKNFSSASDVISFEKLNKMKLLNPQVRKVTNLSIQFLNSNYQSEFPR